MKAMTSRHFVRGPLVRDLAAEEETTTTSMTSDPIKTPINRLIRNVCKMMNREEELYLVNCLRLNIERTSPNKFNP